ncbi:MAG: PhzF family phenazine biosynthesis protein [Planctomycetota bacterium]|nr:PhzF family phenazine biosynthesis protein [Planctomycetota bacterium]
MELPYCLVDAFTDRPFAGNPAAVVLLTAPREPAWMLSIAREMNLSETAFVIPRGAGEYDLRWFTSAIEVPLCGHATLATAHVLWSEARMETAPRLRFHTLSGALEARRDGDWIELDLPAIPAEEREVSDALSAALGALPIRAGKSDQDWLAEFASEAEVRALHPDLAAVRAFGGQGVIATARSSDDRYDFVSRYFAPAVGVDEDPVTGAAHCTLAPWWSARFGRARLVGFQASRRGGIVRVEHRGDRVSVAGRAVSIANGLLRV